MNNLPNLDNLQTLNTQIPAYKKKGSTTLSIKPVSKYYHKTRPVTSSIHPPNTNTVPVQGAPTLIKKKIEEVEKKEESSESEEDEELAKEFQIKVKEYVNLDDKVEELNDEIKKLKKQLKPRDSYILNYLNNAGETDVKITDGVLRINRTHNLSALKESMIIQALNENIKDPKLVEKIFKRMQELRPRVRKDYLRRDKKVATSTNKKKDKKKT